MLYSELMTREHAVLCSAVLPCQVTLSLLVSISDWWRERVLAVHPGAGLQLRQSLLTDQSLHLPPLVLHLGQLQGNVLGDVRDGGGDEELEKEHDVLQSDDEEDCLGPGHVGEDPVDWTRQTFGERTVIADGELTD